MGLTIEQIRALRAKKKVKGIYEDKLHQLLTESDEPGVDVAETWPEDFTFINDDGERVSKAANTLYQGFTNAASKLEVEDQVDIMNREGHVFIMVLSRIEEAEAAEAAASNTKPVVENTTNGLADPMPKSADISELV